MLYSVDCETTGLDFYHGAKPYFVTMCNAEGETTFWEWDVNPLTREPIVLDGDLDEIQAILTGVNNEFVLQNSKFDVAALSTLRPKLRKLWQWDVTHDTLIAGHLLYSNQPHNLTDMSIFYLGEDITRYEVELGVACKQARNIARTKYPTWQIAKEGRPDMPSAKEGTWKFDGWLPRALVKHWWVTSEAGMFWKKDKFKTSRLGAIDKCKTLEGWEYRPPHIENGDHPWWTVLANYGNADSTTTVYLWKVMQRKLKERNLIDIYNERRKLPGIVCGMEFKGITLSRKRLHEQEVTYKEESKIAGNTCVNIAKSLKYDLTLPKSGNNKSLTEFCFGSGALGKVEVVKSNTKSNYLNLPIVGRTESGNPSLDKDSIEMYLGILPAGSKKKMFVKALSDKRKRDTAIAYMEGYRRFWKQLHGDWFVLHPSLNITGSATLRFSSKNPNEQNISKKEGFNLRYCFGPSKGREWWSMDAKNIELRIPFYKCGQKELIDLFERPNDPPFYGSNHLLNFSVIYPDIWAAELKEVGIERVGPHCKKKYASTWYQKCKNGGFAKQYGAQKALTDATFGRVGAYDLIEARFDKLAMLNMECIRQAEELGYVETFPDKRVDPKRGYPIMCGRTQYGKVKPTIPLSYKVQGTAMWWTARAMVKVEEKLAEWRGHGFDAHLIMQVHDELVFDFPKGSDPRNDAQGGKQSNLWRIKVLQKLMESCGDDLDIPTPVGIEYHPEHWGEGITL